MGIHYLEIDKSKMIFWMEILIFSSIIFNLSFGQLFQLPVAYLCVIYALINLFQPNKNHTFYNFYSIFYLFFQVLYFSKILIESSVDGILYKTFYSEIILMFFYMPASYFFAKNVFSSKEYLESFMNCLCKVLIFTSSIIIIFSIYKFICLLGFFPISEKFYDDNNIIIYGTSLSKDYNVYAFGLIITYIILSFRKKNFNSQKLIYKLYMNSLLVLVLFSTSRRGALVIALILLVKFFRMKMRGKIILTMTAILLGFYLSIIDLSDKLVMDYNTFYRLLSTNSDVLLNNNRLDRIRVGIDIFTDGTLLSYLLGSGTSYINEFSNQFYTFPDEDYPHNFIITYLLTLGLPITFLFCVLILFRLYDLKKISIEFFYLILINLFLSLTSSNSLFSISFSIFCTSVLFFRDGGKYNENTFKLKK